MECKEVDIVIIGAGLGGISFARFYLDTHPKCRLLILEKDSCIGGVWSSARNFDDFWVQSPLSQSQFSDCVLKIPHDAPQAHDTFGSKFITQYLEDYVDNHEYGGRTLRDRVRLNAEVCKVEKKSGTWYLQISGADTQYIRCTRLAVAAGLTSLPNMPSISRTADCTIPILHHRDFGPRSETLLAPSSTCKNFTVYGGGKSAADMVYASAKAGKNVSWVIRKTGEGPGIFMNPAGFGRYRHTTEAGNTQKATALNPSGFHPMVGWAQEMHQSVSEQSALESRLFAVDARFKSWPNYKGREGALPGFRDLEPRASFFWNSGPLGAIQREDFWELVSQKVNVYRGSIANVEATSVVLDDGRKVPTDVLLCGTGWRDDYPFLTSQQAHELGLPHDPGQDSKEEAESWKELIDAADQTIVKQYPILTRPPPDCKPKIGVGHTPARLYNGIASLTDSSIIFLGRARLANNFRGAEAQAVWATAYWDGHFKLQPPKEAQREVAYMIAFSRRRYPSRGVDGLNFHADLMWYTDRLASEAGLTSHRKGWWEDLEAPVIASDFRDCKDEYLAKYGVLEPAQTLTPQKLNGIVGSSALNNLKGIAVA